MTVLPTNFSVIKNSLTAPKQNRGFSLVELTIVLIIVALLSTGLMVGMSAQRNVSENLDAQHQLENIREALLGFALSKGRLPCPAKPTLANSDLGAGEESCPLEHGVLPWVTLGLPESDPWGNRFSYFVGGAFTGIIATGAQASFTLDTTGTADIKDSTAATSYIASELPAVVVSHGSNGAGAYQPSGAKIPNGIGDELENSDADLAFVSHTPGDAFDDLVVWIVPSILKSRMVAAGRLP